MVSVPEAQGCQTFRHRSCRLGTAETNPTRNHQVAGLIPGLAQWVKDLPFSHELWCRSQTWLGSGVAVAVVRLAAAAPVRALAWEPSYAEGVALKGQKKRKKQHSATQICHRTNV